MSSPPILSNTALSKSIYESEHGIPAFSSPGHMFFPDGLTVSPATPPYFTGDCSMCASPAYFLINGFPLCQRHGMHVIVVFEQQAHQAILIFDVSRLLAKGSTTWGLTEKEKERMNFAWKCILSGYIYVGEDVRALPPRTKPPLRDFRTGAPLLPGETSAPQMALDHLFSSIQQTMSAPPPAEQLNVSLDEQIYNYNPFNHGYRPYPPMPEEARSSPPATTLDFDAFYRRDTSLGAPRRPNLLPDMPDETTPTRAAAWSENKWAEELDALQREFENEDRLFETASRNFQDLSCHEDLAPALHTP